jgi:hypothetical protein
MRLEFMKHTVGKASLQALINLDGAFGRRLLALLCKGALILTVSAGIAGGAYIVFYVCLLGPLARETP